MVEFDWRRVRTERKRAGLRLEDIATRTGLSYSAVYAIETGARSPNVRSVSLIADALGLPPGALFRQSAARAA